MDGNYDTNERRGVHAGILNLGNPESAVKIN
jgi:hypothetical protein